jgi:Mg2+-importing ATPase
VGGAEEGDEKALKRVGIIAILDYSIMPGGLGTFETASVMSLKSIGLPLPVGLSATLLFRGLSFWLPMIPGLFCSRHLLVKKH